MGGGEERRTGWVCDCRVYDDAFCVFGGELAERVGGARGLGRCCSGVTTGMVMRGLDSVVCMFFVLIHS